MASMAMTSSFLGSILTDSKLPSTPTSHRVMVMAKASAATEIKANAREESSSKRDLVFAAAAAAACSIAKAAMAGDEPKAGTIKAKKKYGPVCIMKPTARICRN